MDSELSRLSNSPYITHWENYPSQTLPTDSTDEPICLRKASTPCVSMASKVTPSTPGAPSFCLASEYASRSVSILQTWTYNPQKRQDFSAFALRYILLLRSCRFTDAFIISSLPS